VNPPEQFSAAGLRHSLRTPLNHVIGYCEMLLEDADAPELRKLVAEAREMARLLQTDFAPAQELVNVDELHRVQRSFAPGIREMESAVAVLAEKTRGSGDIAKIRFAIERLRDFADDKPGAVPALSGSLATPAEPGTEGAGGRILVVDDSAENRDILRRLLEREGYGVTTAADGAQALKELRSRAFDLMLLDVIMPVMDGYHVLREIKADVALSRTPVVMISAVDENSSVVHCIQMGAEDYLMKPFDPVLLSARIGASLEKKRLRDEEHRRTEELQNVIIQLRRTQDQLLVQENLASLGALTAGIAHEIRNPLNFINNFASAAKDLAAEIRGALPPDASAVNALCSQLEKYVGKIDEHGKRADRIVRGMLMHARGRSGEFEHVDLVNLLTDAVNLAYHAQRAQDRTFHLRIDTSFDPGTGSIQAVPQEISRVFLNLLNNAFYAVWDRKGKEAATFEPRVELSTQELEGNLEIRIKDNGPGIAPDVLPKIFNPFFTTKPAGAGTGLGLSISHDIIVRAHHGSIRAESYLGSGTEFIITLPRSQ